MTISAAQPPDGVLGIYLPAQAATAHLAAVLARTLQPGMVLGLSGPLGAGKTTLVRAMLRSLGCLDQVRSPTYTLMEPYNLANFPLYHFDFYRFSSPDEWRQAGFEEYFGGPGVCLVEWPERADPSLAHPDVHITLDFTPTDAHARMITLHAYSPAGQSCLTALRAANF